MKISNASKKVLASALSAAMVVAFAPTVAFGAQNVKVTVDAAGGNASTGAYTIEANGTANFKAPTATKAGYTFDHWYLDLDGNGEQGTSETDIAAGTDVTIASSFKGTEVTLRAVWKAPALGEATVTDYTDEKNPAKITVGLSNFAAPAKAGETGSLKKDTTYTVTVKNPNDVVVGTKVYEPAAKGEANEGYAYTIDPSVAVSFKKVTDSTDKLCADIDQMVGGVYTAEISDGTQVVAKKEIKVVRLTTVANDADKTEKQYRFAEGAKTVSGVDAAKYVDENGFAVSLDSLKAGEAKWFAAASKNFAVSAGSFANRTLTFNVADTAAKGKSAKIDTTKADYAASIVDPSGAEIWSQKVTAAGQVKVTFDQTVAGNRAYNNATEQAGNYVLTVTETPKDGSDVVTAKAKITLTEYKLSAGEHGSFKANTKAEQTDFFAANTTSVPADGSLVEAAAGYEFKEWQLNGKAIDAKNPVVEGAVNEITAAYKVTTTVQAPTVVSASYDKAKKQWTVKLATATAGAGIEVTTDGTKWSNYIDADGFTFAASTVAGKVQVKGVMVSGSSSADLTADSNPVELAWSQDNFSNMVKGGQSDLEKYIGKSKVKFNAEDSIKAAIDAGQAALDTKGVDAKDAWGKLVNEQAKAVYEAVYAFANSELAKYADGAAVVTGDKAYTVAAKDLETAQKAIAAANKLATAKTADATTFNTQAKAIVKALNTAIDTNAKAAAVSAADITAAKAVTDAIAALPAEVTAANGNDVIAATDKILADYAALSKDAKALVSSADYAKVVAAADAADAAVKAADKAAAKKVKGKTVKAKAKKATKSSLKVVKSESGAKSTFAKTSGNSKVKVYKSGKITVKKGLKAGKKYTVKVKATVGTQTKIVKVIVKVAK